MTEWAKVTLGEIVERRVDFTPVDPDVEYRILGVQRSGWGFVRRDPILGRDQKFTKLLRVKRDDLVYRTITAFEAPAAVAGPSEDGLFVTPQTFPVFRVDGTAALPAYLGLLTTWPGFHHEMASRCTGTVLRRKTLSIGAFQAIPIPLPPLADQRRIVNVMAAVDAQVESLNREITTSQAFCESLLSFEAFLGSAGTTWPEVPFDAAIDFREGPGIMAVDFQQEGIPLVRLSGLTPGQSLLTKCNYLDPEKVTRKWSHFQLACGDVLLSTSASLGRVAVVGNEGVGAIPYTGIIRMRPASDLVDHRFIPWILRSAHFADQVKRAGVGVTMAHFGPSHLRKMTVILPPIEEQRQIAATLEAVDEHQRAVEGALVRLRMFRSALLTSLLNQDVEIPDSYDALLEAAS